MYSVPESQFPRMLPLRQAFAPAPPLDIEAALAESWRLDVAPGARVAVAVGSRGIARVADVVAAVVRRLRAAGARPFIVPAMGSHGGATAEGQAELLAGYGITEATIGVQVLPSMEVVTLGTTEEGIPVHLAAEAAAADAILVVNRIKPHTDFHGPIESGLTKMIAVGLGKQEGASVFHPHAQRLGFPAAIASMARAKLAAARFLGGVGLIEDQRHDLVHIEVLCADELEAKEPALLEKARSLMPRLPLDDMDLLIVDFLGKNISGSGMDPNVIGRASSGYTSALGGKPARLPWVRRLFVRDITPESHGNAVGIGLADFTTTRLVRAVDPTPMYMNVLTALSVQSAKIPMHWDSDREVLAHALHTVGLPDARKARVIRIRDTLSLEDMEVSEGCLPELQDRPGLKTTGTAAPFRFDAAGNLLPIRSA